MWCNTRQLHVLHHMGCITSHQFLHHISFYTTCISLLHVILRRKLNLERKQRSERMQECKTEKTSRGEQDRHARSGRASATRGTQSWAASFQASGHTSRACEHNPQRVCKPSDTCARVVPAVLSCGIITRLRKNGFGAQRLCLPKQCVALNVPNSPKFTRAMICQHMYYINNPLFYISHRLVIHVHKRCNTTDVM